MIFQAHEVLKEKNLEKQGLVFKISVSSKYLKFLLGFIQHFNVSESGSAVAVGQNGEINLDREVTTGQSSEGSQEQNNITKILPTSNALDAAATTTTTHNVGSHLPANFTEPSSVPLFIQFMTKLRSSLKSHSNLSLLLITIIALIFFIQVCTLNLNFRYIYFFLIM